MNFFQRLSGSSSADPKKDQANVCLNAPRAVYPLEVQKPLRSPQDLLIGNQRIYPASTISIPQSSPTSPTLAVYTTPSIP